MIRKVGKGAAFELDVPVVLIRIGNFRRSQNQLSRHGLWKSPPFWSLLVDRRTGERTEEGDMVGGE